MPVHVAFFGNRVFAGVREVSSHQIRVALHPRTRVIKKENRDTQEDTV